MRELKFRAWIPEIKEFIYWELLPLIVSSYKSENNNTVLTTDIKPEFVHQFTGLKDRNGKDIYDGDFVSSISVFPDDESILGEVRFDAFGFWNVRSNVFGDYPLYRLCETPTTGAWHHCQIVGDIYRNSKLLKPYVF